MSEIRPTFLTAPPARPNAPQPPPMRVLTPQQGRTGGGGGLIGSSAMTITMVFLALGVIGNLGLTLYLQREKQTATLTEAVDKDAKFIDEITRLRSEVAHMKVLVANGQNEIGRMKIAYQTVIGQIGVVQNAPQSRYAPAKSEAAKLNQPDGPDKALEKSSEKVK